jgi:hypothetical protein
VAACATTQSRSPPNGSTGAASYQTTSCPQPNIAGFPDLDFPSGVQCGYLTVLENRAKPDGRRVRIFVMRAPDELAIVVPQKARSAGTLMCRGAERIITTKQATLGPIDPSLTGPSASRT